MAEQDEMLSIGEIKEVGKALLILIGEYEESKKDVTQDQIKYEYIDDDVCLSLMLLPGAKYLRKNVQGGFTAQVSFQVAYKSFPGENNQRRINSQAVVDDLMTWLEKVKNLPSLTSGRRITKITASNSTGFKDEENNNGVIYASNAVMEYEV